MKVLVYIPCHSDFSLGVSQAARIKSELDENELSKYSVEVILSVNSYQPTQLEIDSARKVCDELILNGSGYMADINISNGFLKALDKKPDIFWLLSTNDQLVDGALKRIMNEFISDHKIDLVVANALDLDKPFIENQIIDPGKTGFSYGVISGAIYRLDRFFPYLHNGPYMAWTGWSHLAVMQTAMDGNKGLLVKTIPDHLIYQQRERDLLSAGKYYGHSIYGMLIIGSILKVNSKKSKNFIKKYVFKNFYNFHLYRRNWTYQNQLSSAENYLAWNQNLAESLIFKSSIVTYIFYKFFVKVPWEKLSGNKMAIQLKRRFDKFVGQSKQYQSSNEN